MQPRDVGSRGSIERLLAEIKTRPVWQVAGFYLGFAWIVLQVIDVLAQNLDLPSYLFPSALALLAIGFAVVLTTAFVQREVGAANSTAPGRLRSVFTWRNAWLGGFVAFAVWGVVSATLILIDRPGSTQLGSETGSAEENTLVVLPFSFQGNEDYTYLGDGIVDLLSTKLDGAGQLRAVDPRAILSVPLGEGAKTLGPAEASALAEDFGAGLFVLGSIIEVGDRLTITAALYDRGRGLEPLVEADATGRTAMVFESVDRLATQLLAGVGTGPAARVQQVAAVSTGSLPALRAYLEGEEAYRLGQYRQAVESFQQAVNLDDTYALAYYRLSVVAEFSTLSDLAQESAELAFRNADRLSERDRGLLEALLAWRKGAHAESEQLYRGLVRTYPDEVEAWFELGEVLMHGNPLHGRPFTEAWESFSRVLELDPRNAAAMYHLARMASASGRFAELDSLVAVHNRLNPGGDRELEVLALQAFSRPDSVAQAEVLERMRSGTDVGVALAGWDVATWTDDAEGARRVVTVLTDPTRPTEVRTLGHAWLAQIELATGRIEAVRGHLNEMKALDSVAALEYRSAISAHPLIESTPEELGVLLSDLEALEVERVPPSRNPSIFYSVHDRVHPLLRDYLIGVTYGLLGDSAGAFAHARNTEQMQLGQAEGSLALDLGASVRAQWMWREGRYGDALDELEVVTREVWYIGTLVSTFYGQALERFLRGELLYQLGRLEEAIPWFANISQVAPYELAFRPLAYERLGRIHERLGQTATAIDYYTRFTTLWRDADPALQPRVAEALARLERLSDI